MTTTMIFAIAGGVIGLIVLFLIIKFFRWILSLRRVVDPIEIHVVKSSKSTKVYGDVNKAQAQDKYYGNSYYEWPEWVPFLGVTVKILDLSIFEINLDNYNAYDKDRLPFVVDIKSFFRINNFEMAASRISSVNELKRQLEGIVQGSSRTILAKEGLSDIMEERSKFGGKFTEEIVDQLKEWGVTTVKNIELMDIRDGKDAKVIDDIMQKKISAIDKESRIERARNNQEAEEAEIASKQAIDLKEQAAKEKVGMREAEVEKAVGIEKEKAVQDVQEQAKITREKMMEVKQVEDVRTAEIDKQAAIIRAEANKKQTEINAEANLIKKTKDAEADYVETERKAAADLIKSQKSAEGIKAEGEAKATAENQMLMAAVDAQLALAQEIGDNEGYQRYLVLKEQIEAGKIVGLAQAENLGKADVKIVAGGGNAMEGATNAMGALSSKGGINIGAMLEALTATDAGKELFTALTSLLGGLSGNKE